MTAARRSDGFTLIEVLVTVSLSLIVFSAAMALLVVAFHSSYGTVQRTDAMQRGRLALDQVTRELRSQVCSNTTQPITSGTGTSVTFYADLSDGSVAPQLHTLTLDTSRHRIVDTVGGVDRVLLDHAYSAPDGSNFLTYYAYPPDQTGVRTPNQVLNVPLSAADRQRVTRMDVSYLAAPEGARGTEHATTLRDSVAVRIADPNDDAGEDSTAAPLPTC